RTQVLIKPICEESLSSQLRVASRTLQIQSCCLIEIDRACPSHSLFVYPHQLFESGTHGRILKLAIWHKPANYTPWGNSLYHITEREQVHCFRQVIWHCMCETVCGDKGCMISKV